MAVAQPKKDEVSPVLDYEELDHHMDVFIAGTDVCAIKLWEWHQQGVNAALLDLRRAYLQIHIHGSLWPFRIVISKGKSYCLMRVGFGLNVASHYESHHQDCSDDETHLILY